jgi:hypothetical protein
MSKARLSLGDPKSFLGVSDKKSTAHCITEPASCPPWPLAEIKKAYLFFWGAQNDPHRSIRRQALQQRCGSSGRSVANV